MGREWAEGVRGWMLTPRMEVIKRRAWWGKALEEAQQWTDLPSALWLQKELTTPDDDAALVALLRARVRPTSEVAEQLAHAFKEEVMDEKMAWDGDVEDLYRTQVLSFSVASLKGLPGITFVWR